jgi:hypothetical protein
MNGPKTNCNPKEAIMKTDRYTRIILSLVAVLLLLNLMSSMLTSGSVQAQENQNEVGRYEIAAWAATSGPLGHHSGYYVLDTMTGKVIDKHFEVHGPHK